MNRSRNSHSSRRGSSFKKGHGPNLRQERDVQSRQMAKTGNQKVPDAKEIQNPKHAKSQFGGGKLPPGMRAVCGTHSIAELLRVRNSSIREIWVDSSWQRNSELQKWLTDKPHLRSLIREKSSNDLNGISSSHGGVVFLAAALPPWSFENLSKKGPSTLLALDGVVDPQNLGAILRTSWLLGVEAIILPDRRSVELTATAAKVASGGAEHTPVFEVPNLSQALEALKELGYWIFGLSHEASESLFQLKIPDRVVWVAGNEEKGLRTGVERVCDQSVSLPQVDAAASFNVSVAVAMVLSESNRQNKLQKKT